MTGGSGGSSAGGVNGAGRPGSGGGPDASQVIRCVAGMATLEQRIEALLDRLRDSVGGEPQTAAAFQRFHALTKGQREALASHLGDLGGQPLPAENGALAPQGAAPEESHLSDDVCTGALSRALRDAYTAFNEATIGYGVLHETAHIYDSLRFGATLRLAQRHLHAYAKAAQEVNQLLAEAVSWELRQEGQTCNCHCPSCDLGICWCIAHTMDAINTAWRDAAPPHPAGGLLVAPNSRRPADLDVREGDLVIAVDGRRVASTADVTNVVMSHGRGEPIRIAIDRPSVGQMEITATRT